MYAITLSNGRRFDAQSGESLLDAALRQQVVLEYSCRNGRCSTCKGRVRSGETTAQRDELGLSIEDKAAGFILTCVRQACSPVDLEIDDLGDIVLPEAKTLPCRIHALEKLSHDVIRVVLRLPPATPLNFLPGQYIDVIGAGGLRRSYSLANAPREDKLVELHIRDVPDGAMSRYWFQNAKSNDLLRLRGPLGTFFLREQVGKDLVLLATGTGIAPVKAILEGLATTPADALPRSIHVYWGGRHREDLYWNPTTDAALAPLNGVRFTPVLSRAGDEWAGVRGHVQEALLADAPDLPNALIYSCGSDAMIQAAQARLCAAGLPARQFHSDAFVSSGST
ncbi:MAG: 2Fe-2S iron-sulfur cluster binding domain-containing protein [Alphaproteobacteria bacterium]|nr:MAG: 2Fe-2S iron-sulfur cluster binding domain-containing protein [Alphaproteobacteria bacterium]